MVHPSSLTCTSAPPSSNAEELVQAVMLRLEPVLAGRLREEADAMVLAVVRERLSALHLRLRQEMERTVRQVVSEAVTAQKDSCKSP
jgi:hypothetical protein